MQQKEKLLLYQDLYWCEGQEKNRFGWLGLMLAIHGCALTPITLFAVILAGNNIFFWFMAMAAMGMSLTINLAAMPTKVTIPTFVLSLIIDIALIISYIVTGFNIAGTYI